MTAAADKILSALAQEREMRIRLEQMVESLSTNLDALQRAVDQEAKARESIKKRLVEAAAQLALKQGGQIATGTDTRITGTSGADASAAALAAGGGFQASGRAGTDSLSYDASVSSVYGEVPAEFKGDYSVDADEFSEYGKLPPPLLADGGERNSGSSPVDRGTTTATSTSSGPESMYGSVGPALRKALGASDDGRSANEASVQNTYDLIPRELSMGLLSSSSGGLSSLSLLGGGTDSEAPDMMDDLSSIPELASYYFENCNRQVAESILSSKPPDTFLLRDSSRPLSFAISYVEESDGSTEPKIAHNLVLFHPGKGYVMAGESDYHLTVTSLLQSYGFK